MAGARRAQELAKATTPLNQVYSPKTRKCRFREAHMSIPRWEAIPIMTKPEILAKYSFAHAIGEGAEGVVLQGYQLGTGPSVPIAAKVVSLRPDVIPYTLVESKLMAATNHAAVPLVIDLFRDEDFIYIIQEFVDGAPLFDLLVEEAFTMEECQLIAHQLLDLLDYLHEHGTIHCDIKPDNVILQRDTHKLYLLDFGSAQNVNARTTCSTGGSIGYFAPEVLHSKSTSAASDMWAMGVLLYTLMSRRPPFFSHPEHREDENLLLNAPFWYFNNDDSDNLRSEILRGDVFVDELPEEAADLILRMLCVEPEDRITAADALKHPWLVDIASLRKKVNFDRILREVVELDS